MKLRMALITAIFCAAAPAWSQTQPGTPATPAPQHIPGQTGGKSAGSSVGGQARGKIGSGERGSDPAFDGHYRNIEDG